jgi:hypothetical protein
MYFIDNQAIYCVKEPHLFLILRVRVKQRPYFLLLSDVGNGYLASYPDLT